MPDEHAQPVTLADGAVVLVRRIEPTDAPALERFHRRLCLETTRRRYFSPHPVLTSTELRHLTCVDHRDREALVATDGTELLGVGRFERLPNRVEAEVAFVVADEWQGNGVGTALLRALPRRADEEGVARLVADTLLENVAMLEVFGHSGHPVRRSVDHGVVHVSLDL